MTEHRTNPTPRNHPHLLSLWGPAWGFALVSDMMALGFGYGALAARLWLEAGCALAARQVEETSCAVDDPVVQMTLEDLLSCGDAIVDAQIETLESWRRAS